MNNRMPEARMIRVCKRDGSVEPFNLAKLVNCMRNGMSASGDAVGLDVPCVRGLAEAVNTYLTETVDDAPVTSARIADLVDLVLTQTGHPDAAIMTRRFARNRERERRGQLVASARKSDGRFVQKRWKKGLLVQHLRRKHMLDAPASRMIAGRVEQLIFKCGLRVVTTGLVTEMARSELLAWGLLPGALVAKRGHKQRQDTRVQDTWTTPRHDRR